jgi:hypothetical protein
MSSDYKEVRELLHVLAGQVSGRTEPLDGQVVGNALYGLQGMSSDCKEVRELLHVLSTQVSGVSSGSRQCFVWIARDEK